MAYHQIVIILVNLMKSFSVSLFCTAYIAWQWESFRVAPTKLLSFLANRIDNTVLDSASSGIKPKTFRVGGFDGWVNRMLAVSPCKRRHSAAALYVAWWKC